MLVDTSVWSLALRRIQPGPASVVEELGKLVRERRVAMMGPIRQEILSGVKADARFRTIRLQLRAFPDLSLATADFETAADCVNRCRAKGIQGSTTDFLMCAVATRRNLSIFTTDGDFRAFSQVFPLNLHTVAG